LVGAMDAAMKQTASIFAPNLAALEDEARALLIHPDFDRALMAFCAGMVGSYTGRRLANIGMGHTLGWLVSVLIIYRRRRPRPNSARSNSSGPGNWCSPADRRFISRHSSTQEIQKRRFRPSRTMLI
jgi:hypothetical protein